MSDPQCDIDRVMYNSFRLSTGAPAMVVIKTSWGYYVETKKGEKMFDQLTGMHCAWCAKAEGVLEWSQRQDKIKGANSTPLR